MLGARGKGNPENPQLGTWNLELTFIKLGGSVLTDKTVPEALDTALLRDIAQAIAAALQQRPALRLLIGHGGGSFGHHWAAKYQTHLGVQDAAGWHGVARVADAMGRLNRTVIAALLDAGVDALGVQPSASALAEQRRLQQLDTTTLQRMLEAGLVPVMYGDVVLDAAQGAAIMSTEMLFSYLALRLQPQRIVLVGEQGVFTADPRRDSQAQRIAAITAANIDEVLQHLGGSHGTDVTGGMASKVRGMWELVQAVPGLTVQLIGTDSTTVQHAILGEAVAEGTVIRG
jgi:isopentenyl phosphate kinase